MASASRAATVYEATRRSGGEDSPDRADGDDRKREVLKRHHASTVGSISDAVVIKDGEPFFLCPPNGQIPLDGEHGYGLYLHDTRFLEGYELRVFGATPESLAATAAPGGTAILVLTNPKIEFKDGTTIEKQRLAIRWTRAIDGEKLELLDQLVVENHDEDDLTLRIKVAIAAGFRDIFEIRGMLDAPRGSRREPRWDDDHLVCAYSGKDGVNRSLTTTFTPAPIDRAAGEATMELPIKARDSGTLTIRFAMGEELMPGAKPIEDEPTQPAERSKAEPRSPVDPVTEGQPVGDHTWPVTIETDSLIFNSVMSRSLQDLELLRAELDGRRYYGAGLPWFAALFGRDSIITALQTLAYDSTVAADTLRLLAGRQGTRHDAWRDEEPGKILHELRCGELARLNEIPQTPYFGTVDATPLFLILLARHASWTGTLDLFHELEDNVGRALDWIDHYGDADGDGYVEYASTSEGGLANQGWKDSGDGIVDGDGRIATPPIRLAEVQGYVYAARREIADLFERDDQPDRADGLREQAASLRARFERDFWSDALDCYVMALQRDMAPCAVVSSNAGQVLFSGIASPDHAAAVSERLLDVDMFSGWGIRTLSAAAVAYNPVGYHLGTVWPHDDSLIAAGFRRYGLDDAAAHILGRLVEAAADFHHTRLPECFAGFTRADFGIPVRYPVAAHPQAWASGSIPYLLVSNLGLEPEAFEHRLRIVRPRLPQFIDHLELRGLGVGPAKVDLDFHRYQGNTDVAVVGLEGDLDIVIDASGLQYPPATD